MNFIPAEALAITDIPVAYRDDTIDMLRRRLLERRYASAANIPVVDVVTRKVLGLLHLEDVLAASKETAVVALMDPDPPLVTQGLDREKATWRAVRHQESGLIVVDSAGVYVGLIPPWRLLETLLLEHDEDLSRHGGFLKSTEQARHATEELTLQRLWHRMPWLLIGLVGAFIAAKIMGQYEETLSEMLVLSVFVPGLVYFSDALSTQTETIVVRGLSLGINIRLLVLREIWTGFLISLAATILVYAAVFWGWQDGKLALIVASSLFVSCLFASSIACAVPLLLSHVRIDPALAAGPLATVIQDILTIAIYFSVAKALLG